MVPRVDPRNNTVRFFCGPASVSTTMAVSWYLVPDQSKTAEINASEFRLKSTTGLLVHDGFVVRTVPWS